MNVRELENLEHTPSEEKLLDKNKSVAIIGAGPVGLSTALTLCSQLKENCPTLIIVEPGNLSHDAKTSEECSDEWMACKGCAGGVMRQTIADLAEKYDPTHLIEIKDNTIKLRIPNGKSKTLAEAYVDEVSVHLPHEVVSPVIRFLNKDDAIIPCYRMQGPRKFYPHWDEENIGLNPFLYELLKANTAHYGVKLEHKKDRVDKVDIRNEKPVVSLKNNTLFEADLVIMASGLGRTMPISVEGLANQGERHSVPAIGAGLESIEVPINEITKRIFNAPSQELTDKGYRSHIFMTPPNCAARYIFALPKVIDDKLVLTIAAYGRVGARPQAVIKDALVYLGGHRIFKQSGIAFDTHQLCSCGTFAPVGAMPKSMLYGNGYLAAGDCAGMLRHLKNGIGTGINQGEQIGHTVATKGYAIDSLRETIDSIFTIYNYDNFVGKQLLEWTDEMLEIPFIPSLLNLYINLETFFPNQMKWIEPIFSSIVTGKRPYNELVDMLQSGLRGKMLTIFTNLINQPLKLYRDGNVEVDVEG